MTFSKARDGSTICTVSSVPLHSSYNPIREAEKFVAALNAPFNPHFVVITEPALSYAAQFLRKKFPDARLFAVRYCHDFAAKDTLWDGTFYIDTNDAINIGGGASASNNSSASALKMALYNTLGEEGLFATFFCAWPPSCRAFPNADWVAWRAIQEAVSLSRDVLATRSKFASRWILNAFELCIRMQKAAVIEKGSAPIVVAASGESLEGALPYLKKRRGEYFLIALSSSLSPLETEGIHCDLCMTTDGGFYAGCHLYPYMRSCSAPIAVPAEGRIPSAIMEKCSIIPLVYPDGPASHLLRLCAPLAVTSAVRNGTVSGTALYLALQITSGNVYFCGLDMAGGIARQHCPPNVLDTAAQGINTLLRTEESRTTAMRFSSASLEIYRQWFASLNEADVGKEGGRTRVFRLSNGYQYNNNLGRIHDVGFDHFYECLDNSGAHGAGAWLPRTSPRPLPSVKERQRLASTFVKQNGNTEQWLREIFPADYIACERTAPQCSACANITGERQKEATEQMARRDALQKKNAALLDKIHRILHGGGNKESSCTACEVCPHAEDV